MNRRIIITLLAAAACSMAFAQTALTLDDCRRLALANNARIRIADGNMKAASEVSKEAFTHYFPSVSASWFGFRSSRGVVRYTLPSVGELLPPGADALIPPEFSPMVNQSLGKIDMVRKGWTGAVYAVQPVFMGGRIVNGNKLAHVGEDVASLQKESAVDEVLVTTEEYYWRIVALQSKRQTLQSVIAMVDTLDYQVSVAVDAGVAMPNDLLKVKLQRNELRASMVDLDNGITLVSNLLAQYVGLDGDSISIADADLPAEVPEFPLDIFVEPEQALASTSDYRLLEQNVKASDLRTRLAVGENLPAVGVGAGWMYDDLISQKHNFAAVMLTVSIPLSDWWGGSHRIEKSRVEARMARIQQEDLSQMLVIGMQNAWDDLTSAYRKLTIAHEAIGQASENLRLNENYYRVGVSTITDLLDAQTLYRQSMDRYTEAFSNFRIARSGYLKATGQLGGAL